jgi:hypothetical protein
MIFFSALRNGRLKTYWIILYFSSFFYHKLNFIFIITKLIFTKFHNEKENNA